MWTEDGLALYVLAVAHQCYTPRVNSKKEKKTLTVKALKYLMTLVLMQLFLFIL